MEGIKSIIGALCVPFKRHKNEALQLTSKGINMVLMATAKALTYPFAALVLGVLLGACSKTAPTPEGLMFSGACKVEVQSNPTASKIYLDGVEVGQGSAQVEIPCGEKQVLVEQSGYTPYYAYHTVEKGKSLKVNVTLNKMSKSHDSFALSRELVEQIKEGEAIWHPSKGPRPELKEGEERPYPRYMGDMKALIASVQGTTAAAGAAGGEEFETGNWDSVEDWR